MTKPARSKLADSHSSDSNLRMLILLLLRDIFHNVAKVRIDHSADLFQYRRGNCFITA